MTRAARMTRRWIGAGAALLFLGGSRAAAGGLEADKAVSNELPSVQGVLSRAASSGDQFPRIPAPAVRVERSPILNAGRESLDEYELAVRSRDVFVREFQSWYQAGLEAGGPLRADAPLPPFSGGGVSPAQVQAAVATGLQGDEGTCARYAAAAFATIVTGKTVAAERLKELSVADSVRSDYKPFFVEVNKLFKGAEAISLLRKRIRRLEANGKPAEKERARLGPMVRDYTNEAIKIKKEILKISNQQGAYPEVLLQKLGLKPVSLDPNNAVFEQMLRVYSARPNPRMRNEVGEFFLRSKRLRSSIESALRAGRPVLGIVSVEEPGDHAVVILGMDRDTGGPQDRIYYYDSNAGLASAPRRRFYPAGAYVAEKSSPVNP